MISSCGLLLFFFFLKRKQNFNLLLNTVLNSFPQWFDTPPVFGYGIKPWAIKLFQLQWEIIIFSLPLAVPPGWHMLSLLNPILPELSGLEIPRTMLRSPGSKSQLLLSCWASSSSIEISISFNLCVSFLQLCSCWFKWVWNCSAFRKKQQNLVKPTLNSVVVPRSPRYWNRGQCGKTFRGNSSP